MQSSLNSIHTFLSSSHSNMERHSGLGKRNGLDLLVLSSKFHLQNFSVVKIHGNSASGSIFPNWSTYEGIRSEASTAAYTDQTAARQVAINNPTTLELYQSTRNHGWFEWEPLLMSTHKLELSRQSHMLDLCRHILYARITSKLELELCRHIFTMLELRRKG